MVEGIIASLGENAVGDVDVRQQQQQGGGSGNVGPVVVGGNGNAGTGRAAGLCGRFYCT